MKDISTALLAGCIAMTLVLAASCTRHEVDVKPVEIKPIHITLDVNVRIDRAVDDFFSDIYEDKK